MDKILRNEVIKTDFIISMGPACRQAHYLRKHNLRHVVNPLDWMMGYSLDSAIHWFKNDFDDFFLEIEENKQNENTAVGYRWIIDKYSETVSIHHFPIDRDLTSIHEKFLKIMKKRSKRMIKIIKKSNNILFISNRNQPKEDFYKFLREFK
ncbi:MAG: papain-like cysteine peptidase, partial [Methanobrevibacter sp.]|nr:papain-like cysteine peptidase [Methanobrevibacter sp.]